MGKRKPAKKLNIHQNNEKKSLKKKSIFDRIKLPGKPGGSEGTDEAPGGLISRIKRAQPHNGAPQKRFPREQYRPNFRPNYPQKPQPTTPKVPKEMSEELQKAMGGAKIVKIEKLNFF